MVQAGQLIFLEPSTSTFSIPLAKALLELDKWKTMLMVLQSDSPSRVVVKVVVHIHCVLEFLWLASYYIEDMGRCDACSDQQ